VDAADVKALPETQAVDIFLEYYFARPGIARLPEVIQASVFDMYVNAGSRAVKILQDVINTIALEGVVLTVDGAIGPQTVGAVTRAAAALGVYLVDAYGIARREFYYNLADRRPALRKFATRRDGGKGGWIARAEGFIRPRYHLTDAAHRARVAEWG